jgi:hypothetical protein
MHFSNSRFYNFPNQNLQFSQEIQKVWRNLSLTQVSNPGLQLCTFQKSALQTDFIQGTRVNFPAPQIPEQQTHKNRSCQPNSSGSSGTSFLATRSLKPTSANQEHYWPPTRLILSPFHSPLGSPQIHLAKFRSSRALCTPLLLLSFNCLGRCRWS